MHCPSIPNIHRHLCSLLASSLLLASALPASAQVSKLEGSCRGAISKATGKYIKAFGKAVVACHVARDASSTPSTDCNDLADADPDGKVQKTKDSAIAAITEKCAGATTVLAKYLRCPAPFQDLDDGGLTLGIDDFAELAACLLAQAESIAAGAATNVMGSPPSPPLSASLAACHKTLGSAYTKVIDTTIKVRSSCQKTADKTAGSLDFVCATADPKGKIAAAEEKARAAIIEACGTATSALRVHRSTALEELGSCADSADALASCVVDQQVEVAAGGAAAMAYELPGTCPGAGGMSLSSATGSTQTDIGYNGYVHDMEPIVGYQAVSFPITCDADCNVCNASAAPVVNPDACRCSDNAATVCDTNSDCSGQCTCNFGPPTPISSGGTPACVVSKINGALSGSYTGATGAMQLDVPLGATIHTGISITHPCPRCINSICDSGQRSGLACSVDGHDATFGDVSYDCPPALASNIGTLSTIVHYTTGAASIPYSTKCDAPDNALDCACAACSGNTGLGCASNADCAPAYGTCTASNGQRSPNKCYDGVCSVDPADSSEGYCAAGPNDSFCDGFLRANGDGVIPCSTNASCDAFSTGSSDPQNWVCPNDDCGACSLHADRDCFLKPIEAVGSPGERIVGVGCFGMTANGSVNVVVGLPGPYRIRQNLSAQKLCPDGVTAFYPPGGSNCP